MNKKTSRNWIIGAIAILLLMGIGYAFWPKPLMVDIGQARRAPMAVTISEEAKTRVEDAYVVSAPISGRLMRVDVEAGDVVIGGETIIANLLPAPPSALDVRTREQARAAVGAAEASVRVARADLNKVMADQDLAEVSVSRARKLYADGAVSQAALDLAIREFRAAAASMDTAKAAISMREAELASAQAQLISFSERPLLTSGKSSEEGAIPLTAPVSGHILRVVQKSETTLVAGTPILEIGDVSNDLEIVAELLSTDAVQVAAGDRVIIENWGGEIALEGVVERVEPWGFTKFSALGVEEQRVNTIIKFTAPITERSGLGHGYRVETNIVIWEDENAMTVSSSALFRDAGVWAVFRVEDGRARQVAVEVGHNNGVQAEILDGISEGDSIILYPGPSLESGSSVRQRTLDGQ